MAHYPSHTDTADKTEALAERYHADEFSPDVYRASLFALGWRGADLDAIMRQEMERAFARKKNSRRPAV